MKTLHCYKKKTLQKNLTLDHFITIGWTISGLLVQKTLARGTNVGYLVAGQTWDIPRLSYPTFVPTPSTNRELLVMPKKEIRLRVSGDFHALLEGAADARDIPITALLTVAAYDYIARAKSNAAPSVSVWRGGDDEDDALLGPDGEPLNVGS